MKMIQIDPIYLELLHYTRIDMPEGVEDLH